jgi:hypothetical protein
MKQTAVEWLFEQIPFEYSSSLAAFEALQQAKEMDKQQTRSAFMEGYNAGREDATESCEAKLDMLVNGNYAPKVDYSNAPTWEDYGITEGDIIFNAEKHEGTNYLYKGESGYHGFKDRLSKEDMEKGGFLLIWERVSV